MTLGRLEGLLAGRGPIRTVGVVGMGYVGIPSAALFADHSGIGRVYGFQRDSASSGYKIALLNRGESPLNADEPGLEELLRRVVTAGKFSATADFSHVASCDAVTVAIQTPFADAAALEPDYTAFAEGVAKVGRYLSEGTLVVIESTVTPGTTEGLARHLLEEGSGMKAGVDFALAHAPERVMVGRLLAHIRELDRCVGGIDEVSTRRAAELYRTVLTTGRVIPMTARAAEVTKTAENTFRDLQIAAANQLALYCESMRINFYDVRAGIDSLKGEGITRAILRPGAGVGGHCLTKDSYHLERGARMWGTPDLPPGADSLFIVARRINDFMPRHLFALTADGLAAAGVRMDEARIAVLGWAFIQNSDDARNTPAGPFVGYCRDAGAEVAVHDPFVAHAEDVRISSHLPEVLHSADAIVVVTAHDAYSHLDPDRLREFSRRRHPVLVDGRNVVDADRFIASGFVYRGIGRGDKNSHDLVEPRHHRT